ncbi:MAG: type II toxin-antitoxin system Phd/YefM family antitoxin [Moorea sp. SIO2B7]|nr:type II toxin-antitoxin system Phd/YefM family antitoxin [Moorena sp. SIO2B7]
MQNLNNESQGFIRLSTDEVKNNLVDILRRVIFENERIIVQQGQEDIAAIIPVSEFEKLSELWDEIASSQFSPEEEEYYQYERGIHCLYLDDIEANFHDILEEVKFDGELFALLPPENLGGKKMDSCEPGAILINLGQFWIPESMIVEKNEA